MRCWIIVIHTVKYWLRMSLSEESISDEPETDEPETLVRDKGWNQF